MAIEILDDIYNIIDSEDFLLIDNFDNKAIPLFKEFGEAKNNEGQIELVRIAQLEIDVQNFQINDNEVSPTLTGTDNNGQYFEYPSLKSFTDEDYTYLIKRQKHVRNASLKIRYSHLLWLSSKKHLRFALDALVQYRKVIRKLNLTAWEQDERNSVHSLKHHIFNAYYLALSTGRHHEIEKIKKLILPIAKKFRLSSDKTYINIGLIQLMLNNPKVFKQTDFKNLDSLCLKYAEKQPSLHSKIDILKVGQKVSNKLGDKTNVWLKEIAKAYDCLSIQREDGSNLAALSFCQDALKYYKKLKDRTKIKELEDRYKHLKQTMQLGKFSQELDLTDVVKELKPIADTVLKKETDHIISFLMYSPLIFPSYQLLYDLALKQKNENSFDFLFATTLQDEFGHTSAHYIEEDEKIHLAIMQSLDFYVKTSSIFLLREIIIKGVQVNKLSAPSVINFLQRKSWLGQDILITYTQGEQSRFNWLHTIVPALNDFFSQVYFFFQNPINVPNFILSIDSLALKLEGILRDICELRGVTTFFQTDDGRGRSTIKEKDINVLLREEIIKNTLTKDDLMLLQFLLVDKAGWNLRNKVAHTLIRDSGGYGLGQILLLIICVLKLAKNEYGPPLRKNNHASNQRDI